MCRVAPDLQVLCAVREVPASCLGGCGLRSCAIPQGTRDARHRSATLSRGSPLGGARPPLDDQVLEDLEHHDHRLPHRTGARQHQQRPQEVAPGTRKGHDCQRRQAGVDQRQQMANPGLASTGLSSTPPRSEAWPDHADGHENTRRAPVRGPCALLSLPVDRRRRSRGAVVARVDERPCLLPQVDDVGVVDDPDLGVRGDAQVTVADAFDREFVGGLLVRDRPRVAVVVEVPDLRVA